MNIIMKLKFPGYSNTTQHSNDFATKYEASSELTLQT